MSKKILQKDEKVLRKTAVEVPVHSVQTAKIKKILKEMSESLKSQSDGVAIAAPQIGYSLRIFIVSGKVLEAGFSEKREESVNTPHPRPLSPERSEGGQTNPLLVKEREEIPKDLIFINPKISKLSRKKDWVSEGCLSVRPLYGRTFRSKKATVTAYDENGRKFTRGASGLLAQIFQHETDHLDGILFTDHAKDIKAETPK